MGEIISIEEFLFNAFISESFLKKENSKGALDSSQNSYYFQKLAFWMSLLSNKQAEILLKCPTFEGGHFTELKQVILIDLQNYHFYFEFWF